LRKSRSGGAGDRVRRATEVLGLALLLALWLPTADASSVRTIAAPYGHTHSYNYIQGATAGPCRSTGSILGYHWVPNSGNVTGNATASVRSCKGSPSSYGLGSGSANDALWVYLPLQVTSGPHNLTVSVSYDLTLTAFLHGSFRCPAAAPVPGSTSYSTCVAHVVASATWGFYVLDATNRTLLSGAHPWVQGPTASLLINNDSTCNTLGKCSWVNFTTPCTNSPLYYCVHPGSVLSGTNHLWLDSAKNCVSYSGPTCTRWQNWSLVHGHHYWLEIQFDFGASAFETNFAPGLTLDASLRGAGPAKPGWVVNSITLV
jgi:hypothetical protein